MNTFNNNRRKLMRSPSSGPDKFSRKRFSNDVYRKYKLSSSKRSRYPVSKEVILYKFRNSNIHLGFLPSRENLWKNITDRSNSGSSGQIDIENFSFLDNPIRVMNIIESVCIAECTALDARLNFLDKHCLDIGAYMILGEIIKQSTPIFSGGFMQPSIAKVIDAVGIGADFGMRASNLYKNYPDIWAFRQRSRRPAGSSRSETRHLDPQSREKVADSLVDSINEWLGQIVNQELTKTGKNLVAKIVGEVLDNAERHSDKERGDGDWKIAGFMAKRQKGDSAFYRCHLAFLSIGESISDSMIRAADKTRQAMEKYIKEQGDKTDGSKEKLMTLFALQDGITSDPLAFESNRGGTGLMDILDFFCNLSGADVASTDPQMVILSGNSYIKMEPPFVKGVMIASTNERQLWFNGDNVIGLSPHNDHVRTLPYRLNGTLISMAFNFDRQYLEDTV